MKQKRLIKVHNNGGSYCNSYFCNSLIFTILILINFKKQLWKKQQNQ